MILRDIMLVSYRLTKDGGLTFAVKVKDEDITDEQKQALYYAWQMNASMNVQIELDQESDFQEHKTREIENKRQTKLWHVVLRDYCDFKNLRKDQIYKSWGISSSTELEDAQFVRQLTGMRNFLADQNYKDYADKRDEALNNN